MGRKAKLKAARREGLVNRKVEFPYGGENCDIKVVRRFTPEDLKFKNWDKTLVEDIFDTTTDVWIDFSISTPGVPLYFVDSGRFNNAMTPPRKETWNAIAANPGFQQDIISTRDDEILWFGITHKNSNTAFFDYTYDEANDEFIAGADTTNRLELAIAYILTGFFDIRKKYKGLRSLFFLLDSEEKGQINEPSGGSIFFIR
ncbi:MAG: hypothetical protein AAFV71_26155 [Cyanobacteria bacterium J06633_8]